MTLIQPWPPSLMRRTGPVWGCYFWTEGLQPASRGARMYSPRSKPRRLSARPNRAGPRPGPEPRGLFLWATRIVLNRGGGGRALRHF
jgi:hypothetical protein